MYKPTLAISVSSAPTTWHFSEVWRMDIDSRRRSACGYEYTTTELPGPQQSISKVNMWLMKTTPTPTPRLKIAQLSQWNPHRWEWMTLPAVLSKAKDSCVLVKNEPGGLLYCVASPVFMLVLVSRWLYRRSQRSELQSHRRALGIVNQEIGSVKFVNMADLLFSFGIGTRIFPSVSEILSHYLKLLFGSMSHSAPPSPGSDRISLIFHL